MIPPPPRPTLFPYTTLFRSCPSRLRSTPPALPVCVRMPLRIVGGSRSEEHTSELQSRFDLVCRLLIEKKKKSKTSVRQHQWGIIMRGYRRHKRRVELRNG